MLKSSLLEILRTFSKQELVKFEDFVRSPYFNKKENVIRLFSEIRNHEPGFNNIELEKEKVWEKLFLGQKYNYGIMKNLIHDLGKLCESFLSQEIYNTNDMQRSLDFLTSLFTRNISNIFQSRYDSVQRTFLKKYDSNNYVYINRIYEMLRKIYELKANFNHSNAYPIKNNEDLKNASEYLIYGFLTDCFRIFHKLMVHKLDLNQSLENNPVYLFLKDLEENSILSNILKYSEINSGKDYKILNCYYSMYKSLLSNESVHYYNKFKSYLSENSIYLSKDEVKALYVCLLSCLTNLKITTNDFYKEYFSLIQLGFESKVMLTSDGTITFQSFFSIVNVSCGAKEIDFAETFIENYKEKLPSELRENTYLYSMAQLNFTKKNYEKSLEFLIQIQKDPGFLKYSIKNLQMSIYFELNDRNTFDYSYDSFKHFIKKNKLISESRVITLTKYCDYIKKLFKQRESFDAFELSKLKNEITANKVVNKMWLLEKIEELENS